ncbi:hypothetical protein [Wenjunlia tyrosinilytica]|uniref:hypothetical protein n=1 Tax=Wenjunlia tyrosinilytica TaxID=1544741 RepID=UPI0016644197|nr:hypothetical protein [Wenjunlia tyrosinilytica]
MALLVVSDDIDELYALGDRFHVMRQGELVWQGTSAEVTRDELVELIASGTAPEAPGTAEGNSTEAAPGEETAASHG